MSLTCWLFGHSHDRRERTADGYMLICDRCGQERPMLQSETIKGPRFHQEPTLGKPKTVTFRVNPFGKTKVG